MNELGVDHKGRPGNREGDLRISNKPEQGGGGVLKKITDVREP